MHALFISGHCWENIIHMYEHMHIAGRICVWLKINIEVQSMRLTSIKPSATKESYDSCETGINEKHLSWKMIHYLSYNSCLSVISYESQENNSQNHKIPNIFVEDKAAHSFWRGS